MRYPSFQRDLCVKGRGKLGLELLGSRVRACRGLGYIAITLGLRFRVKRSRCFLGGFEVQGLQGLGSHYKKVRGVLGLWVFLGTDLGA